MNLLHAVILGFIQGATEFLPISSSGHLVLAEHFLEVEKASLMFDVALHLGTLFAVVTYFRLDFWGIAKGLFPNQHYHGDTKRSRELFLFICLATIPGVLAGLVLGDMAEYHLRRPAVVAFLLAGLGLLLMYGDKVGAKKRPFSSLSLRDAVLIGVSQALAIMPGVSRSGITMTTGLFLGLDRQSVAKFSFLLSAPIILGAGVYHIPAFLQAGLSTAETVFFLSGMVSAAVSGYLFIAFLMKYVQARSFAIFAYYRFALAGIVWLALLLNK